MGFAKILWGVSVEFQTVLSSVRPARVAVLINKNDQNWSFSVQRVLEFLTQIWGGEHSLLIPTDGVTIAPVFWSLLEAFDPDYIYKYLKTGKDDQLSNPEQFNATIKNHVTQWLKQNPGGDESYAYPEIEKMYLDHPHEFDITEALKARISKHLVPFNFKNNLAGTIRADSLPHHPLTAISDVVAASDHEKAVALIRNSSGEIPFLWYAACTGVLSPSYLTLLEESGVKPSEHDFAGDDVKQLIHFVVSTMNGSGEAVTWWGDSSQQIEWLRTRLPFTFSMHNLSRYRSIQYREEQEPVIAIAGNTVDDFCLYFALSRLRDRVVWIFPPLTEKALQGNFKPEYVLPEFHFANALNWLARGNGQQEPGLVLTSISLTDLQLQLFPPCFSAALMGSDFDTTPQITKDIASLIRHPFRVYETANVDRDQTKIVVGEELPGFFDTPKPKRLRSINPSLHRWIVDLRFYDYHLPRHPALAPIVATNPNWSSKEVRMSSIGPAYFPLSFLIQAGEDIDRSLVRPQLRKPSIVSVMETLAKSGGFKKCAISDKGFYSQESLDKFGGLRAFAHFFRDAKKKQLVKKFLDTSENTPKVFDEGTRLSIDRRRYLNFPAFQKIIGNAESSARLIDDLLRKGIILRGLILKCRFCRNADWFALAQVGQEFDCRRCGRRQHMTRENWFGADADAYEASFYYKLDEIVFQGLRNDMDTPLLTLAALQERSRESFLFAPEMCFFKGEEPKPWMEADLLCISDGVLTVGEVKSAASIGATATEEKTSLMNYRELAKSLGARRIVLATGSSAWNPSTQSNIDLIFKASEIEVAILTGSELLENK
jgi:hypothetical protein